jgi:hypothetical protein
VSLSAAERTKRRVVGQRRRDIERARIEADTATLNAQYDHEQTIARNAAERTARYAAGVAAEQSVRSQAPTCVFEVDGVRIAAVILGSGDTVVSATALESVSKIARVISQAHRSRLVSAHTSGSVPPLDIPRIVAAVKTAAGYSERQGTAKVAETN